MRSQEGVLLLHGFGGSPAKFHYLKEALKEKTDFSLSIPLLSGHGTRVDDMKKYSQSDWINDAIKAYEEMKKHCTKINVIGYSMGGLLALKLASLKPVNKLALIAPALFVHNKYAFLSFIGKYFIEYHRNKRMDELFPKEVHLYDLKYNIGYEKHPVKSVADLVTLEHKAKRAIPKITAPLCIIQSEKDDLVKPESAQYINEKISSTKKEIVWLKESRHLCVLGPEKEIINKSILDFLSR